MKTKLALTLLAIATASINLHAATSTAPAPLPEFMDDIQAAKWTADQAAATQATSAQAPSNQFYTGKPFVAEAGGYVFKYRTYNPEMSRWTSADPSGFPDGVNNFVYAKNQSTYSLDANGLETGTGSGDETLTNTMSVADWSKIDPTFQALLTTLQGSAQVTVSLSDVYNKSAGTWATAPTNATVVSADNPGGTQAFAANYVDAKGNHVSGGSGTFTLSGLKATISTAAPTETGSTPYSGPSSLATITFSVPVTLNYTEAANITGADAEGSATPTETIDISVTITE